MKMWPLEFNATPDTSPRYRSGGSFRRFGTESKGISGTASCANAARTSLRNNATRKYFIGCLQAAQSTIATTSNQRVSIPLMLRSHVRAASLSDRCLPPYPVSFPFDPDHAMARHDQRDRDSSQAGMPHRARRRRIPDSPRQFAIADRFAERDPHQFRPHAFLKLACLSAPAQNRSPCRLPAKIFFNLLRDRRRCNFHRHRPWPEVELRSRRHSHPLRPMPGQMASQNCIAVFSSETIAFLAEPLVPDSPGGECGPAPCGYSGSFKLAHT